MESKHDAPGLKLAFIGLGVMGWPMAAHLLRAGHRVAVYNRSAAKAERWVAEQGSDRATLAASPAGAAHGADIVLGCVGNDDDVKEVTVGREGAFQAMPPDAVYVDHTTASASVARELAGTARDRGLHFVDAPVSGGQAGAQNARLSIMCGGETPAFERVRPVLSCYAAAVTHVGASGSGQLAKMVNQICIAGLVQGLAEGLLFGQRAGLDMNLVVGAIGQGAASSWQMQNRASTMLEGKFDFGFAVEWMRKDLGICLDEARRNGAPLPVAELVKTFYDELQQAGGGRWDTSSLIERLRRASPA